MEEDSTRKMMQSSSTKTNLASSNIDDIDRVSNINSMKMDQDTGRVGKEKKVQL
jgi:hypothetical protein